MTTGVWIVGALGDVATTAVLGARAIAADVAPTTGLVTATARCAGLDLVGLGDLVFGGHDVREGSPLAAARALAAAGVVPARLVEAQAAALEAYGARVQPGVAFGAGAVVGGLESEAARTRREAGPRAAVERIRADLAAFRAEHGLERVVVVALASTEPKAPVPPLETEADVLARVEANDPGLPASTLYALAAFEEGCPYVNFTPSLGAAPAGLRAIAEARGVPHMGCDGKTGQTLVRTALAPMFRDRNLDVLSWAGFNILGNRDGEVLDEPAANEAKTTGKDRVLGAILGEGLGTSLTRIDYVPSLGDWKTAWDHVHFAGFLGTAMQLELTWRGADSALAAPLVLDLVRLIDLAARRGRVGLQTGLASFFKNPHQVDVQDFPGQVAMLDAYLADLA